MIALCVFAGLRVSEARALEVRDIDFTRESIHLRRAFSENELSTLKNDHDRIVPLIPELASILRAAVRNKLPRARVVLNNKGNTPSRKRCTRRGRLSCNVTVYRNVASTRFAMRSAAS